MEKLSGLVLDVYDDGEGAVLRSIFPAQEDVPAIIKEAHFLKPEERAELDSDVFALELVDGDVSLRKFACTDPGNTALSVEYFLKTGYKLPEEAQKTAAANLVRACGWYDITPPEELTKVAIGLGTLAMGAMVLPGAAGEAKKNLQAVEGAGGAILTPQQVKMRKAQMGVG
jgi:hypothetical protein